MSSSTTETVVYDNGGQYAGSGIPRYERVFGPGYVSPGGQATTSEIAEMMQARGVPVGKLLDVGSGIGGPAFYMHDACGYEVLGADLAPGMHAVAEARAKGKTGVSFVCADAAALDITPGSYDVVYSRDTLLHVADKKHMFERIFGYLRSGGWCVFTDYAQRNDPENNSPEFAKYVADSGYSLPTLDGYQALLESIGFQVELVDWTDRLLKCLEDELARLRAEHADFVRDFSQADFDYLSERWERKIRMVKDGSFKWPLIFAKKP